MSSPEPDDPAAPIEPDAPLRPDAPAPGSDVPVYGSPLTSDAPVDPERSVRHRPEPDPGPYAAYGPQQVEDWTGGVPAYGWAPAEAAPQDSPDAVPPGGPGASGPSGVDPGERTDSYGKGSVVLGVIGLFLGAACFFGVPVSIVAILLGSRARKNAARGLGGNAQAGLVGMVLGWIGLGLSAMSMARLNADVTVSLGLALVVGPAA